MRNFLLLFIYLLFVIPCFGERIIKDIYLKDGTVIRGEIIDQTSERTIVFKSLEGKVFVFDVVDIKDVLTVKTIVEKNTVSTKKAKEAFALSFIPPIFLPIQGIGQIYNGQIDKGLLFFVSGCIGANMIYQGYGEGFFKNYNYGKAKIQIGALIYLVSWVWSSIDAYNTANISIIER